MGEQQRNDEDERVTVTRSSGVRHRAIGDEAVVIRRVVTESERREAFRIRYEIYVKMLGAFPENPEGLERDQYDAHSVLFLATVNEIPVGTIRLVQPNPEGRFPMEDDGFVLPEHLPRERTREVSRLAALPGTPRRAAVELQFAAYLEALGQGATHYVFDVNDNGRRFMDRYGWRPETMGEPINHHGAIYYPYWMPLEADRFGWEEVQK